jgi:hypothetical protein
LIVAITGVITIAIVASASRLVVVDGAAAIWIAGRTLHLVIVATGVATIRSAVGPLHLIVVAARVVAVWLSVVAGFELLRRTIIG